MRLLTRSFYAKVFLMFIASMLSLYVFNQSMVQNFGNAEVRRITAERHLQQNLQWSRRQSLPSDAITLKQELLQSMRTAHPDEVVVYTESLDQNHSASPSQSSWPGASDQARVTPGPVDKHFPLISHAVVEVDGMRWNATRLIAPDSVVISLINQSVNDRGIEEFLEFRQRMIHQIMPLTLLLAIACAFLLSRRVLAPIRHIQQSLRSLDYKDLSLRIPHQREDDEFREFIETFNSMLERLERGFQQASRFSSDAAHELRTPLTIMRGNIERAIKEAPSESHLQAQLCMISEEIDRLTSITHKLLLLAQADTGRLQMDFEVVNVSDTLNEMRSDVAMIDPPLTLRGTVENDLMLSTDRALFQQLLNNLFSNAVKYNEEKGWIEISAWRDRNRLHIRFTNPNSLIDKAFEEKVFDRFSRADVSRSRSIDGIGLGLSLSREIALANGGSLDFRINTENEVSVEFSAALHLETECTLAGNAARQLSTA